MYRTGRIDAQGAFTGDFGISPEAPADRIPREIERDREIMTLRPGMRQKHLPVQVDPATGRMSSGGRYLFDSYEDAEAYRRWVLDDFVVDGVRFPERRYFVDLQRGAWRGGARHRGEALRAGRARPGGRGEPRPPRAAVDRGRARGAGPGDPRPRPHRPGVDPLDAARRSRRGPVDLAQFPAPARAEPALVPGPPFQSSRNSNKNHLIPPGRAGTFIAQAPAGE